MLLASNKWREMLKSIVYQEKLKLIAVDEAHTVLQWYIYELYNIKNRYVLKVLDVLVSTIPLSRVHL